VDHRHFGYNITKRNRVLVIQPFLSPTQIKNFLKKNQPPVTRQLSVMKRHLGPLHGGLSSQLLTGRRKYATWK
jgi:hypothetical protein